MELFKKTRLCYELQNLTVTLLLGAHKTMLLNIYTAAVMSQKCKVVKRSAEPDSICKLGIVLFVAGRER